MKNQPARCGHRRNDFARNADADEHGVRREEAREGNSVRLLDRSVAEATGQCPRCAPVTLGRRLPLDRDAFAARRDDVITKSGKTDVENFEAVLEKRLHLESTVSPDAEPYPQPELQHG